MAMESHDNILALPSAKILYLIWIDVPTPTPIEVLEPLFDKVLIPPSI